mgnify:CR=1 FL=1
MKYRRMLGRLMLLVALTFLFAACTMSASTPPPEENAGPTPTKCSIMGPTATNAHEPTETLVPTAAPVVIYPDLPTADCSVEYLNDFSCLREDAFAWIKENDLMTPCIEGICPQEPLTLIEFQNSLVKASLLEDVQNDQIINEALSEVFSEQSFDLVITRGPLSEVFRLVFYPEYECEYQAYYTDMDEKNDYTCGAEALLDNGLYLVEDLNTDFKPEDEVTREQFAVFLYLQVSGEERLK